RHDHAAARRPRNTGGNQAMTRTQCLGLMIRDMIEGHSMQLFDGEDEVVETGRLMVEFVDASDADNPIVHFEDGSTITVRIIREAP
ncbi:MAG: hypothetical protein WA728_04500, partial [Xanthobacteraceae bacterium]